MSGFGWTLQLVGIPFLLKSRGVAVESVLLLSRLHSLSLPQVRMLGLVPLSLLDGVDFTKP
jgi:hypothetical protein